MKDLEQSEVDVTVRFSLGEKAECSRTDFGPACLFIIFMLCCDAMSMLSVALVRLIIH